MEYERLLKTLRENADEEFRIFQKRLIFTKSEIIGVRTPTLRKIAKSLSVEEEEIFSYPDDYFEITFLKLALACRLPFEKLVEKLDTLLPSIDNWGTCDTFKPKAIAKNKRAFLPYLEKYFASGKEFYERFVLVTLLSFYVEEEYLPLIKRYIQQADASKYYVYMAAAWLFAEILVKFPSEGIAWLQEKITDEKTHNKAIQKARESFRIDEKTKEFLKTLKRK